MRLSDVKSSQEEEMQEKWRDYFLLELLRYTGNMTWR